MVNVTQPMAANVTWPPRLVTRLPKRKPRVSSIPMRSPSEAAKSRKQIAANMPVSATPRPKPTQSGGSRLSAKTITLASTSAADHQSPVQLPKAK